MKVRVAQHSMWEGRRKAWNPPPQKKDVWKSSTCVHLSSEDAQTCLWGCRCFFCGCTGTGKGQKKVRDRRKGGWVERLAGCLRLSHEYVARRRQGDNTGSSLWVSPHVRLIGHESASGFSQDLFLRRRRRKVMKEASDSEEQRGSDTVRNRKHHKQNYFNLIEAENKSIIVIEFSIIFL